MSTYKILVPERIRRSSALTQKQLAARAKLSHLYVIRAEQGLPATLGYALSNTLSELDPYGREPDEIDSMYQVEREQQLQYFRDLIRNNPNHDLYVETALGYALDEFQPGVGKVSNHPLYLFRTKLMRLYDLPTSAIKFCVMFNVHTSNVSAVESRKDTIEYNSVLDKQLRNVIGLSEVQAEMLRRACDGCL